MCAGQMLDETGTAKANSCSGFTPMASSFWSIQLAYGYAYLHGLREEKLPQFLLIHRASDGYCTRQPTPCAGHGQRQLSQEQPFTSHASLL